MEKLLFACKNQNINLLEILKLKNISLNQFIQYFDIVSGEYIYTTPLIYSIKNNKNILFDFLLEQKIDINIYDKHNTTALIEAVKLQDIKLIARIALKKANWLQKDSSNKDALDYFVDNYIDNRIYYYYYKYFIKFKLFDEAINNIFLQKLIQKIANQEIKNPHLSDCGYFEHIQKFDLKNFYKIINFILKLKPNLNQYILVGDKEVNLFDFFVFGTTRPSKVLRLGHRQNILHILNDKKQNFLMLSCIRHCPQWSEKLIRFYDINAQDIDGNTALHHALSVKNYASIQQLLHTKNIDLNIPNHQGITQKKLLQEIIEYNNINEQIHNPKNLNIIAELLYFNPKLNSELLENIMKSSLIWENKYLFAHLYYQKLKPYKKNIKSYYPDLYNKILNCSMLSNRLYGTYGFESECSILHPQNFYTLCKLDYILSNSLNSEFTQDISIEVDKSTHMQIEVKSRIIGNNNNLIDFFCTQQLCQIHGFYKKEGDDHIHVGIKHLNANDYNIDVSNEYFHVLVIAQIIAYFVRYWDIFKQVAYAEQNFDNLPFEDNPKGKALFLKQIFSCKTIQDLMSIIQNKILKSSYLQWNYERYATFNLLNYKQLGTLELRGFTLVGYKNQAIEPYGSINGILLCNEIFSQSLEDVINNLKFNKKLGKKNQNIFNIFNIYVKEILKGNLYSADNAPNFSLANKNK